jgi:hypothetical protein
VYDRTWDDRWIFTGIAILLGTPSR